MSVSHITLGEIRKLSFEEGKTVNRNRGDGVDRCYKYVVLSRFHCVYRENGVEKKIIVERGFLTDGASGGAPDFGYAWLFHDWLYATHSFQDTEPCTRQQADKIMTKLLENDRLMIYRWTFSWLTWANPFYVFSSAWSQSGRRGPEYLK